MTIQDLENLEGGVASGAIPLADLLSDYCPDYGKEIREVDPLCSLHNFIVHSRYFSRMKPSPLVVQKAIEVVDRAKAVLFPGDDGLVDRRRRIDRLNFKTAPLS